MNTQHNIQIPELMLENNLLAQNNSQTMSLSKKNTVLRTLHKFADSHHYARTLIMLLMLMAWGNSAWAATVEDLVTIRRNWTFVADKITNDGNTGLTANTLYANNRIFAPTANSVSPEKGQSSFSDGTKHLNSLRLKTVQDRLAFKVSQPCTITFFTQNHNSRGIRISKQDRTAEADTYWKDQPVSTPRWEVVLDEAGTYYLSNYGGDFYFAGFEITGIDAPDRTFTDFKIDFRSNPYNVVSPAEGLPDGVVLTPGTYFDAQHGYQQGTITVPVDGIVKFTIGGCQFTNKATVSIDSGATEDIDTKTPGCDGTTGYTKYAEYYYKFDKAATLTFNLGNYCPYFEAIAITEDQIPSTAKISFSKGSSGCEGTLPVGVNVELGSDFTLPSKYMVYKENYTLTAWNDGKLDHEPGETINNITEDITFTPVFTANSMALGDAETTVNWTFSKKAGAPAIAVEGNKAYYASRTLVNGTPFDALMLINAIKGAGIAEVQGKCNNGSSADNAQVNRGTVFTIPAVKGMIVTYTTTGSPNASSVTFGGEQGTLENKVFTYTYTGDATELNILAEENNLYPSGISVTYPAPEVGPDPDPTPDPEVEFENFELDLRNIQTNNYQGEVPAGLTIKSGTSHKSDHGFTGFSAEVVVDGPVKITLGGCQFANGNPNATIAVKNGANLATLNIKTPGCYHNGGVATYIYKGGAATLTITGADYTPYLKVEKLIVDYDTSDPEYDAKIEAGNATQLLHALANADGTSSDPFKIYLPNGTYDLGSAHNTRVPDYTEIIGESRDGVIIKNTLEKEVINATATLQTGSHVKLSHLTLKCRAKYGTGDDSTDSERGVCLEDKGTDNLFTDICLDGLQDTYYSNGPVGMTSTFNNCIIRGNTDFICGSGNITFVGCTLEIVSTHTGDGKPIIVAPSTYTDGEVGYIFENCTVSAAAAVNDCDGHVASTVADGGYYLARGWYGGSGTDRTPRASFYKTTFNITPDPALWTDRIGQAVAEDRSVFVNDTEGTFEPEIEDVTESTTWDWTKTGQTEVKFTDSTPIRKDVTTFAFSNSLVLGNPAGFNAAALLGKGEYAVRNGKYFQGQMLKFHTTVAGKIKVVFSNTGNRYLSDKTTEDESLRRYLVVNGENTGVGSCLSKTQTTTEYITVPAGDVILTSKYSTSDDLQYLLIYSVEFKSDEDEEAPKYPERTATWDWHNGVPASITSTSFEKKSGTVDSDVAELQLAVDATSGKLDYASGSGPSAQFNTGTIVSVPVRFKGDIVTVVSYPGMHNFTVGGTAASTDETRYVATAADAAAGKVDVVGTGSSYLYSITVKQLANSGLVDNCIYSSNFQNWDSAAAQNEDKQIEKHTSDGQTLTFSLMQTQVVPTGTQSKFSNDCITNGYLVCEKKTATQTTSPYIKTSSLASVSKVTFVHAATASKRGWGLKVKGDGDADWVTLSSATAAQEGTEVEVEVNRKNVQLWFYNITEAENAYLTSLNIYDGETDPSTDTATPVILDDVPSEDVNGLPETEVQVSLFGGHYQTIQWYKNETNSTSGGTAIPGAVDATLKYTPTSADAGKKLYFYAVLTNPAATGTQTATSRVATVNVSARTACELEELILSNGFNTFIDGTTVKGYYMSGTEVPTVKSSEVSAGAQFAIDGGTITITAEDGTTTKTYTYTCEAVEPLTARTTQTMTNPAPEWLKGGIWSGGKLSHEISKTSSGAAAVMKGETRVYLFVGPTESLVLGTSNTGYANDCAGTYSINGGANVDVTLQKGESNLEIRFTGDLITSNKMVEIVNNGGKGWGFDTVQLPELLTITFNKGSEPNIIGTVPEEVKVMSSDGHVKIPTNTTLYRQGYTLDGWSDGDDTYETNKTHTFTQSKTLTPVWRKNIEAINDGPSNKTITWKLCPKEDGPSIPSGVAHCFVQQERIIEETNDIALNVAKIQNRGDSWITFFSDEKIGTYLVNGSKISFDVYYKGSYTLKVDETRKQSYEFAADGNNNHCEFTYTGESGWVEFTISKSGSSNYYLKEFKTSYPTKAASNIAIADGKQLITLDESHAQYTLTKGTDYTTSSTGAMHYTSSDESIVKVSDAGVITKVAGGDAKVTVRQEGDNTYGIGTITFDVHVKAPVTLSFNGAEKTGYSGERIGTGVIPEGPAAPTGQRFHGWFTATDGTGDRASEVYVVKKATDFQPYFMDIPTVENGFIMVPTDGANNKLKGDALLNAIEYANEQAAGGQRKIVFIPNGTYDLGTQVLSIVGSNVSLIGESMEGVIIQNEPSIEGLDNTATFKVTGDNVVMQNLTIKNRVEEDLDGTQHPQGVCIEDAGAQNVYREVRLLGMQNTYYASDEKVRSYIENSEIHGTVDIVGGNGDVWFEGCDIKIEPANVSYIAAPATTTSYGFIFNGCTISSASTSMASKYYLGRGYTAGAKAAFHNTTKTIAYKETGWGKNIVAGGTFVESASAPAASVSTVVTNYTNDNKLNAPTNVVLNKETHTLTWNKVENAYAYIIYKDGKRIAIKLATADATQSYEIPEVNRAKSIRSRSMTTAAAIEGGYSVASVSATGIIGDAKAEAQIPAITKDIAATTVYVGKAQTFAIEATDATSYQWYKSNTRGSYLVVAVEANKIAGATSASYSYTATEEGTAYLVCQAKNGQGSAYSTVIPVTAQNPVITQNLNDKYGAVKNTEKTFNVVAEGGATYQWYRCDDATGANPVAIDGATSSMLTQTWDEAAVGKSYYIFCKVNGVVNSAITTVTVAAAAEGGTKTYHADGTVFETYDFASLVAGGAPNLSIGNTPIRQEAEGTNPLNVYVIDNPKGTVSAQTLDLNGRFAVNNKYNSGEQLRWMWRSSTNAYQNGLAGNWNNKGTAATSFNMSILGLYAGDKVTINYSIQAGKTAQLHVVAANQIDGLAAEAIINSKQTYTIANAMGTEGTSHLDLYCTNNNMAIQSITIESHYYATSEPQISTNLPAAVKAYKDVPRVLSVAASDADSYQWYKATSAEASAKTTATPIEGANDAAYVYTPTAAGSEYYFCVVSNANGSKSSDITTVTTVEADVKTFDFLNMDENDKTLVMSNTKTAHKGNNGANNNYDIFTLDYPRDLRGYMAIQNANIAIADAGLKVVSGSGNRVGILTGLAEGDVVTFIGTGLNGNVGVESGANGNATCTVMTTGEVKSIQMTSAGDLNFWLDRYGYGVIKQIIVTRKTPPVFTQNLNEKYFVTTGGALTLNITASNADTYQWYSNTHASNMGGELIPGATTASYTPATSANGTGYYYCVATNAANNTVAVSNVAQVDVANVVFRDFELDIRQKRDYGLTEAEAVQGQTVDFGILVDEDGTLTRVAETTNVNVSVHGTYESTVLGLKNATFTVPVQGKIKFSIGKTGNDDKAKDYGDVIVKDAAGNTVATLSTKGGKWSSNKKNVIYGYYTGPSTTLTFTTSAWVPYIRVEKVEVAELNAPTITQTTFDVVKGQWAVTMATNVDADGARIYYTTDGTDPTVGSTLYNGTAYVAPGTTIKAIAVCDGWYASSIGNRTTSAQPETKGTEVISYHNGEIGDNIGMTYTVAASYNAGKPTGEDGLKMNLTDVHNEGDNTYTVNGFRINVNNGYRITGIDLNDVNFTYTKIYVDGVVYEGALNALNATQTIDFVCEGSTPINTKITLSYEFADDVTGITVNGVALTAEQVTAFKNKSLEITTEYKGAPEVVVTTALGYSYPVTGVAGDRTTYTYGFTKVGDCQMTFTTVLKALPVITFNESKFYYANPDGAADRGKGYNFTVSGADGGTYTINIDDNGEQAYNPALKYYAIEKVTVKYSNDDASYPKDVVTANVASTDFDKKKPFAIYLYAGGYTDQNMEPKPLEAKMILEGIGETYNVVLTNKGDLQLTGDAGTKDLDNLGKADLIVLSEAMSSSEKLFQTFDYKNGTAIDTKNIAYQLGLGTTNVLNFKIFAAKESVWNWATPEAVDTKNISFIPSNPLYSVFNGVHFNDDANHTIDLWNDNHAPLLNHMQGVWKYVTADGKPNYGPQFVTLATAQASSTQELDVLQYRYSTPLADAVTPVADDNKVFVNFGLNINDYSAYDENVKTIVGNICRMINDHTPLNSIATSLTKPVITDNGDGSAKIMTSTSMATIKYVTYDAAPGEAPTAEFIKNNGVVAVNGMTKQFGTDKYIYAIAMMDGMEDSPVSGVGHVTGSPLRKITRRALPEDDVTGVEVTQTIDRNTPNLKVPYNQTYRKEGYTVTSWIDSHTGTEYFPGEALELDQDLDLVAQWTMNTKSVTDLCGGPNEQRTATFNFLMKDGAPEMKLDGNFTGVLVGQVRFSNERGDFIDVVAELSGRETLNPQSGRTDAGKLQNNFTNSWNWLSGDGTQIKEYCQIKTGTVFTFPAVSGMTVNFKATDLERDEEASHQVQVHRSFISNSVLTDGTITNPAYTVDVAGNYILTNDNFAEGGIFSYSGQASKTELVVRESSMVYERPSTSEPKENIFEHEPGWNDNSVFMDRLTVTYPALYKVTPKLDPAISEIVADGSEPTANITYSPAPAKNADGKFTANTAVKMIVTPTYAYRYDTSESRKPNLGGTVDISTSGEGVPEDGAVYSFTMPAADKELPIPMVQIPTRVIASSPMPRDAGRIVYDPDYTSFADGKKITLTAMPKVGYEFVGWSTDDNGNYPVTEGENFHIDGRTLELTVNSTTENYTYYAQFRLGKQGTVNYKLGNAVLLNADGTTENGNYTLTDAEKNGFPASMTKSAMIIPTYYTMYKEGYTLDHWQACDENGVTINTGGKNGVYDIGTYYYFDSENEVRNIKPVFKKNKTKFDYRTTEADITWDFRTAYFAQSMEFGTNKSDIHYSTHSTFNREKDGTGIVTMDVPLVISTGNYGKVNNQTLDEWCTLGEGTTIKIPSGLDATFTLASYSPITSTKIDDDVLTNYVVRKENNINVYVYTYKTKSPKTYVTLTIGDDFGYYKYIRAQLPSAEHVDVNTAVNIPYMGVAEVTSAGTIPNGDDRDVLDNSEAYPDSHLNDGRNYYTAPLGSYVTFVAKRNRLYEFDKWLDADGKEIVADGNKVIINTNNNTEAGGVTSTLIMQIEEYLTNVKAVFKERSQYQVNYTAGKLASGIAPAVQVVEKGETFTLPSHNQVLYYEGHTLKYWLDEDGNRYDFGQTYTPQSNLYLSPVFEPNEFAFSDILNDVTMTWPLAVANGATDINFRGSSGIIVDQMEYEGMKIDMKLDIKSSSTTYRAYNNTNDDYCLISDGINIEIPSTPGCKITLNSYSENVSRTEIAGATSEVAGANTVAKYSAGLSPTVIIKQDNTQGAQTISFKGDSPSFTSISVTYTAITGVSLPELTEVTIGGVAIGTGKYDRYSIVDLNSDKVLNNIPVEIVDDKMPEVVVTKTSNSKESGGKWTTSDEITYVQATVDNPTATIILKSAHGIIAGVYKLNFRPQKITGSPTLEKVNIFRQDREGVDGVYVVPGTVAPNSMVTLTFNRAMAAKTLTADDITVDTSVQTGTFHGTIHAEEGKDLKFSYWDLDLGKTYRFTVKPNTLKDIYGNYYDKPLTFQFTISDKLIQSPDKRPYDFVVTHRETFDHSRGKDKASQITMAATQVATDELIANLEKDGKVYGTDFGTIDQAIERANASNIAGDRSFFRIFVPDGEYQIGGNDEGKNNFNPRRDFSDNKDGMVIAKDSFPYNNGMTYITRPRTSVIGQSQDKTVIFSDPYFYGISYTSTLEVRPNVTDCYFQDLTLDNRYSWHQMRSGTKPAGQCAAFYDRGQRTIMKNVGVLGYQDSYVSDATQYAQGKMRSYYETSTFAGTVDFICGDGDIWWEQCKFLMRYRAGNNFIAPRQSDDTKWGYVFNNCVIDAEDESNTHAYQEVWNSYAATYEINNEGYHLGRPWENSPYVTLLNTKMILPPAPEGWMNMKDAGLVLRFHELGTTAADGSPVDLSTRTTRLSTPGPGSFDVVMTQAEAEAYTMHSVLGGEEGYDPRVYTAQMPAVTPGFDDTVISWRGITDALCYAIFKSDTENGEYKLFAITSEDKYDCGDMPGWYKVRTANQRGGLGEWSKAVQFVPVEKIDVEVKFVERNNDNKDIGWSTVCLPFNAKVPDVNASGDDITEEFKVYAAVKIADNTVTLQRVHYITAGIGYVIYGTPGIYTFKGSSHTAEEYDGCESLLDGNPTSNIISAAGVNCYTLSYKPNVAGIGFYKFTGSTLAPYKAYLTVDTFNAENEKNATTSVGDAQQAAVTKGIRFVFRDFRDEITGIYDNIVNGDDTDTDVIYDLSGRRVHRRDMIRGGIYIVNGRKVAVKK